MTWGFSMGQLCEDMTWVISTEMFRFSSPGFSNLEEFYSNWSCWNTGFGGLPRFWNTQKQGFNMALYSETDGLWALNKDCYVAGGGGWLISHNFLNHLFHPQGTGQQLQEIQNNPLALSLSDQEPVSEGRPSTEAPPSFNDLRHMRPLIIHLGSSGCGCGSKTRCYWEPQNDVISRKLGAKKLPTIIQNHPVKWKWNAADMLPG